MTFTFACKSCGHDNAADLASAGRTVACAGCATKVRVPAPGDPASGVQGPPVRVQFACPACDKTFTGSADLVGKQARCRACNTTFRVKDAVAAPPPRAAVPRATKPPASADGLRSAFLFDDDHAERPAIPTADESAPAPRRRAAVGQGGEVVESVLPSRSEKMAEVEREQSAKAEAKRKRQEKKQARTSLARKQVAGGMDLGDVFTMLGFSVAAVLVLGGLAALYPGLRFPIGGMLCLGGGIVYLLGTAGFSAVARDEGTHFSLMCKFVPLYKWYYLYSRWDQMKGHFTFFAIGLLMLWPGLGLLNWSPEGKEAEKSDKAYRARNERDPADEPPPVVSPSPGRAAAAPPAGGNAPGEVD